MEEYTEQHYRKKTKRTKKNIVYVPVNKEKTTPEETEKTEKPTEEAKTTQSKPTSEPKIPPITKPIPSDEKDFIASPDTWFDEKEFLKGIPASAFERHQDDYFSSYSHFSIHEEMLKDRARTGTYKQACDDNADTLKGKTVMDIGCGTGILSIFTAKAGAKQVFAIDNAHIADYAKEIVKANKLSDIITVMKTDMENVKLPVEKVDVIISEWMGYCLLYESMLDCILDARDKFLAKDGIMMPDKARMRLAAVSDEPFKYKKFGFWDNVYGVDMRVIKPSVEAEPVVDYVNREDVISDSCTFADFDLYKVTKGDLTFANKYECVISKNASLDAFVIWFDVMFGKLRKPVELSTSPFAKKTHWSQTILYLKDSIRCNKGDKVYGTIAMRKNPKRFRDLDIVLTINYKSDGSLMKKKYLYKLT